MNDDVAGIILFLIAIGVFFLIGFLTGSSWGNDHPNQTTKNQTVCTQYLHGTWHEDICLVDGRAVPTK